jgi:hypothetical protein
MAGSLREPYISGNYGLEDLTAEKAAEICGDLLG